MKPRCPRCYTAKAIFRELKNRGNKRYAAAWQEIRHRHTKTSQCRGGISLTLGKKIYPAWPEAEGNLLMDSDEPMAEVTPQSYKMEK